MLLQIVPRGPGAIRAITPFYRHCAAPKERLRKPLPTGGKRAREAAESAKMSCHVNQEESRLRKVEPILWTSEGVVMLDQRRLPNEVVYHTYTDYRDVAKAIKDMV